MDLLERLIEEAKLHGRARLELEMAKDTAGDVAAALQATKALLADSERLFAGAKEMAESLAADLQQSKENERAAVIALRDVTQKIDEFARGTRRRRGKARAALSVAKGAAEKFVVGFEARRPGVLGPKVESY